MTRRSPRRHRLNDRGQTLRRTDDLHAGPGVINAPPKLVANRYLRIHAYRVRISYDPAKRSWTLAHRGRLVVIGYTPWGAVRHVFSMRKAHDREQARFAPYFGL